MKVSTLIIFLINTVSYSHASLRGNKPWRQLKCTISGLFDESKCNESTTHDGEPCSYCIVRGSEGSSGMCVNPEIASEMEKMNPQISCHSEGPSSSSAADAEFASDVISGSESYDCTIKAFTSPDACFDTVLDDGTNCEYCSLAGPLGEYGVCVSPDQSSYLKKFAPTMNCASDLDQFQSSVQSSPVKNCNIYGSDEASCLDPSKVNGSECIWCDTSIGGFCFPKSWHETASKYLTCSDGVKDDHSNVLKIEESSVEDGFDHSFLNSSCVKKGLKVLSSDECRASVDLDSGEHCVYCKSTAFSNIGMCMPPSFKGNEGRFYSCDKMDDTIAIE